MEEYFFNCPWCGEPISMVLDLTASSQSYIEDCEVCCRPIDIRFQASAEGVEFFQALKGQ